MKSMTQLKLFACVLSLSSCTGINIVSSSLGIGEVTNPSPDYAHPLKFIKGGGVYHRNYVPLGTGRNSENSIKAQGCSRSVLFLAAWGDSSYSGIMKKSGIRKIAYSEAEQFAVLGSVYHSFCNILYGTDSADPARKEEKKGK
ncbi:MAG TPA: TRL domain-containing protein [Leptospiraceae bacterium]|nr:TRL domain-containing protein [Leptospiraceae bacterium]HNF25608.1 TRL domain-containing protein [Leptospiraceae bacterium]